MDDIFLIVILAVVFVVGYLMVKRIDVFLSRLCPDAHTGSTGMDPEKPVENDSTLISLLKHKNETSYLYDSDTLRQGLEKMRAHGYTALPVITKDGKYTGTVNEGDFLWHMIEREDACLKSQEKFYVRNLIRAHFNPAVNIDATMSTLLERAVNQNFVPVVDGRGCFIGIVTRKDIILHYSKR